MSRKEELERELYFLLGDCETMEEKIDTLSRAVNKTWNFSAEQAMAFDMGTERPSMMARIWDSQGSCQELLDIYRREKK